MTLLFLDIETLPSNSPDLIAEFSKSVTAPGQYKKQESIDAWLAENRESAVKEMLAKTSFDGLYGRIACIAWAFDDGEIYSTDPADSELDLLTRLYVSVEQAGALYYQNSSTSSGLTVVGHNIAGFDLPFLKHRSILHGIKPQANLLRAMGAKPWGAEIADTMLMWSSDRDKRVSMDKLCRALGIPKKDGFDGSMVAETWPTDPMKVIEYCKADVDRTRQIYKRLTFA